MRERGDVKVVHIEEMEGGFALDYEPEACLIGIPKDEPNENGIVEIDHWVFSVSAHYCMEPTEDEPKRPQLRIVK